MKTIVCVKRVPDSETKVKIDASGKALDKSDIKYVINPYDEYALEQAVRLKEAHGGEVLVVCMGSEDSSKEIRSALAVGADRALFLEDSAAFRDPLSTAQALANAIKNDGFEFDAIFMGKRAIDSDGNAVGPMLAHLLDAPCVSNVGKLDLDLDARTASVSRGIEGGEELLTVPLPSVFTCDKALNEPRYPSLKGIMAAKKKPLETIAVTTDAPRLEVLAMAPPPPRPPGKIIGEGAAAVPELVRLLHEEAKKF